MKVQHREKKKSLYVQPRNKAFTDSVSDVEPQAKPHDTHDLCVLLNNDLAQKVSSNPRRFVGLGTLPMQAPDLAVLEMKRCVKDLGFPGVQIGSHINSWDLNAPELFPFYAVSRSDISS